MQLFNEDIIYSFFIKLNELLFIFLNIYKIYIENDHQLF